MPTNVIPKFLALILVITCSVANAETISAETRISTSTFNGQTTTHESPAAPQPPSNQSPKTHAEQKLPSASREIRNFNSGLWVYDLLINLNTDYDADGFFSTFSISLDVDNSFSARDVYAVFYLSQYNGPLLEYAVTGNFTVSGSTESDSIYIETTLETGYSSDYYDVHAEIYDANTGALLVTYGPADSGHVTGIPFESEYEDNFQLNTSLQLSFSGTGSLSTQTLLFFIGLILYRFTRKSGIFFFK